MARLFTYACGLACFILISGCQTSSEHADDILANAFTDHTPEAKDKLHQGAPLYCYATIGKPDCYKAAQSQHAQRLSGYFKPVPEHLFTNKKDDEEEKDSTQFSSNVSNAQVVVAEKQPTKTDEADKYLV